MVADPRRALLLAPAAHALGCWSCQLTAHRSCHITAQIGSSPWAVAEVSRSAVSPGSGSPALSNRIILPRARRLAMVIDRRRNHRHAPNDRLAPSQAAVPTPISAAAALLRCRWHSRDVATGRGCQCRASDIRSGVDHGHRACLLHRRRQELPRHRMGRDRCAIQPHLQHTPRRSADSHQGVR